MKVTLLANTPDPEKLVAASARLCYSKAEIDDILDNFTEDKVEQFINKLISLGHESPLEHVTFTFGIEDISRACSHQLVRHRIASYSQKSQRYITEGDFSYVIPDSIVDAHMLRKYSSLMDKITETYQILIDEGVPKEDARMILPNACTTSIIVTMNVRSLLNFFKHRDCKRAQWEIRALAQEMMRICKEVAPRLFAHAGASCRSGKCSEGSMSCGEPYN